MLATVLIVSNAFPKSSIRSSVASIPIDTRISPSVIPSLFLSSGDIPECDVAAGLVSRLSTPPRLGAIMGIETFFMIFRRCLASLWFEAKHAAEPVKQLSCPIVLRMAHQSG